ncbi:MAG TPA: hypothetical protein VF992_10620 [Thermoplasmata archaeon]
MKIGIGMILGIVGGLVTAIGSYLPWATVSGGSLTSPVVFMGVGVGWGGVLVLAFGVLGLICVAIPRKATAILALVWGILAFVFALLVIGVQASLAQQYGGSGVVVTTEYGAWVSLAFSVLLILGSAIAYREARKAASPPMAPPMSPPPMQ